MACLKAFIDDAVARLSAVYPREEARAIILNLYSEILNRPTHFHITEPSYELTEAEYDAMTRALKQLLDSRPLQYVLGYSEFYGRRFRVNEAVLIPRPETEQMVQIAIGKARQLHISDDLRIVDLCTGSSCIAWTMALELPSSRVVAVDISDDALALARSQFSDEVFFKDRQPDFRKLDVLKPGNLNELGKFDILLSNPPYVLESEKKLMRSNVLDFEPHIALFVPDNDPLLFYRAEALAAPSLMNSGAFGILEINEACGEEVAALFSTPDFTDVQVIKDFSGRDRFVSFIRV